MIAAGVTSQNGVGVHSGTVGRLFKICIRTWRVVRVVGFSTHNVAISTAHKPYPRVLPWCTIK
jgi:hypothetical protein